MMTVYSYELWNGKEVVGRINLRFHLSGNNIIIPETFLFKKPYDQKFKTINLPVITRFIETTHEDMVYRTVFDVRHKSKRQIDILKRFNGLFL